MVPAQGGVERLHLQAFENASPLPLREPITLPMRVAHRLASYAMLKPRRLLNAMPLVSFSFDDVPDSAVAVGARVLEEHGARGTFFISTGLLGRRTPDWRMTSPAGIEQLASHGHEIALHTHRHRPLAAMTRQAFEQDLRRCADAVGRLAPGRVSANFAYPFGFAHPLHQACLERMTRSSRTTHPGINQGRTDLHYLRSFAFGSSLASPAVIDTLLDATAACGGWLILTGHDVAERPSAYGCTPGLLDRALGGAAARAITVATIEEALDHCGVDPLDGHSGALRS